MHEVVFEVGEHYENRKGIYKVLAIEGDVMQIRWKAGEEATTSVTMQSRIIGNMKQELEHPSPVKIPATRTKKSASLQPRRIQRSWSALQ